MYSECKCLRGLFRRPPGPHLLTDVQIRGGVGASEFVQYENTAGGGNFVVDPHQKFLLIWKRKTRTANNTEY